MLKNRKPKSFCRLSFAVFVCLIVIVFWPASYFWSEGMRLRTENHRYQITTGPGWVAFTYGPNDQNLTAYRRFENQFIVVDPAHRSAMAYTRIYSSPGDYRFYFPLWMLSLLVSVVAGAMLISDARRRRRYRPGSCPNCGYDLRATPQRCPECGAEAGG